MPPLITLDELLEDLKKENHKTTSEIFVTLAKLLNEKGKEAHNTLELLNVSFNIIDNGVASFKLRKFYTKYYLAENVCYFASIKTVKDLVKFSDLWNNFEAALYGYTIFERFKYNQLNWIIMLLKRNPESRRAIIKLTYPIINEVDKEPCAKDIHFFIRDNQVKAILNLRSSDFIYGLFYDLPFFRLIHRIVAESLGIKLGELSVNVDTFHCYFKDLDKLNSIVNNEVEKLKFNYDNMIELYNNSTKCEYLYTVLENNSDNLIKEALRLNIIERSNNDRE